MTSLPHVGGQKQYIFSPLGNKITNAAVKARYSSQGVIINALFIHDSCMLVGVCVVPYNVSNRYQI